MFYFTKLYHLAQFRIVITTLLVVIYTLFFLPQPHKLTALFTIELK